MKKTINVLSIDGGGIRGILPAEVLKYVELRLQQLTKSDIRLADHFDLIAGTSTGGILSCIYSFPDKNGNPKYSAVEASELYLKYGGDIFEKKFKQKLKTLWGLVGPRYSHKNVENLFDQYFGEVTIKNAVTNIMLTSVNTNDSDLYLFKSFKAKINSDHDFKFFDAVRSTSAAPTYFQPHKIMLGDKELSLIDGGMAINNPSVSAYIEAMKMFPKATKINMISIGTGRSSESLSFKKTKKWGILNWILPLFDVIMASSGKAIEYEADLLYKTRIKGEYLRVDPILGEADDEMDNACKDNLKKLKEAGIESVKLNKDKIDQFLKKTV